MLVPVSDPRNPARFIYFAGSLQFIRVAFETPPDSLRFAQALPGRGLPVRLYGLHRACLADGPPKAPAESPPRCSLGEQSHRSWRFIPAKAPDQTV